MPLVPSGGRLRGLVPASLSEVATRRDTLTLGLAAASEIDCATGDVPWTDAADYLDDWRMIAFRDPAGGVELAVFGRSLLAERWRLMPVVAVNLDRTLAQSPAGEVAQLARPGAGEPGFSAMVGLLAELQRAGISEAIGAVQVV